MKNILLIFFGISLLIGIRLFFKESNDTFNKREAFILETNECLQNGDWICAENNIKILLKENPTDENLQLHFAGILFEEGRYEECIAYVNSRNFNHSDLEFLKEKSKSLLQEISALQLETSTHFRVEFEGRPAKNDILEALSVLEVAYDSLCHLFDFRPANIISLVLYESKEFAGIGNRPDWAYAVFDGKLRIPTNAMAYREIYRPMIFHELTHAFLRAMTRGKIPTWLNEGMAQIIEGTKRENTSGNPPTLKELTEPFVNNQNTKEALKLYGYSQKMVESLLQKNGDFSVFKDFIQSLKNLNTNDALQKFYGITEQELLQGIY